MCFLNQTAFTFFGSLQPQSSGLGCCTSSVVLNSETPTLLRALQPQLQPGKWVGEMVSVYSEAPPQEVLPEM